MSARRDVIMLIGVYALATPFASFAQQAGKIFRVGIVRPETAGDAGGQALVEAFRRGLRDLGYVEGRNISIELRWLDGQIEQSPLVAAEFVRLKVDCIVSPGTVTTRAAQKTTNSIPIVMANSSDPVADGFIASLARPGGNITGMSSMLQELIGKQLDLLKQTVPGMSRVAVLWNPDNPGNASRQKDVEPAARKLGMTSQSLKAVAAKDLDVAFAAATRERAGGLLVLTDALFQNHRSQIVALAAKHRLPVMYTEQQYVTAGGLMVYAPDLADQYRRAATFVDKILKGAKPADLPVEQPTKFDLVINMKTAKALGMTIPRSILIQATKVIE